MSKIDVCLSHGSDEWSTPKEFFDSLDSEFHFTLDPCSTSLNHLCENFFTKEDDGLSKSWIGHVVFCNPPYSQVREWVFKSLFESFYNNVKVVMLIPARVDTIWFHHYVLGVAEVRFLQGRLKFSGSKYNAPFPSMVCIFDFNSELKGVCHD